MVKQLLEKYSVVNMKSFLLNLAIISILCGCTSETDHFYSISTVNSEVIKIENERITLDISKVPEETTTITIDWRNTYDSDDLNEIEVGDLINKEANTNTLLVFRHGKKVNTIKGH
ncbi:MAG: hypothetical protein MK066_13440 [Crocinitomicaceae bacterium]|nr:hypothetical protein [Crocinitomicaceae bacterium]